MIIDSLQKTRLYAAVHPDFEKAFAFLERAVAEDLPVGKYEIDGTNVYAMVQEYTTKPSESGTFEGHQNYIDIQFILSGVEIIEFMDITKAQVKTPYDPTKDAAFFCDSEKAGKAILEAGEYGIFYPHDIHKPGRVANDTPCEVRKIVVKVKV